MMRYIQNFVEQAIAWEKQSLLDHDWLESIQYNLPSIIDALKDQQYFSDEDCAIDFNKLDKYDSDYLLDYFFWNQESLLSIGYGYHCVRGFYALDSFQEIAAPIPEHWHITDKRREVINRYSDLYLSARFDAAYITTDLHLDIELKPHDIAAHIIECRKNAAA